MKTRRFVVLWLPSTFKPSEVDTPALSSGPNLRTFSAQGASLKGDGCSACGILRLFGSTCALATVLPLRFNLGVDEYFAL
jgi:hypothetical protein